jgi:hypothetical protein
VSRRGVRRAVAGLTAAWIVSAVLAWGILSVAWPVGPIVHVRWQDGLTEARRVELEREFDLSKGALREGATWQYRLTDWSTANIRTLVEHAQVVDTHLLDRQRHQPQSVPTAWRRPVEAIALGGLGLILVVGVVAIYPRTATWRLDFEARSSRDEVVVSPHNARVTVAVLSSAILTAGLMTWLADASFWSSLGALAIVYAGGYLVGSLFVARVDGLALALIRTVAGLMLTAIGYLLSLVLSVPWFVIPGSLIIAALVVRRRAAFAWPHEPLRFTRDGLAAAVLVTAILSPIVITFFYMAPGSYPPVIYNVDTAYSLEKVHALVATDTFPPSSLGNLGVRRTYHYGTQAMAALISRGSGLLPHHSLFLIVLPVLTAGLVSAAAAVARHGAPAVPRSVTVPLLLISVPSLSRPFLGSLWKEATSLGFGRLVEDASLWGIHSNEAQNVAGDFVIVGGIAGMVVARSHGWLLPTFLIGTSVIFKTTVGIAVVSGFALAEAWRSIAAKRVPSPQMVAVGAMFAATYGIFFLASFQSAFRVELYPLEHMRNVIAGDGLAGLILDALWLFLPALIVVTVRMANPETRSAPFLIMAIAPLVVMNTTRLDHVGEGGEGAGLDWVQISHSVPFLMHVFALSLASHRWNVLGRSRRAGFLVAAGLVIVSTAVPGWRYSIRLLRDPASGHEFVDNRSLAQALETIPKDGAIIVTNDLRYPADGFRRDDRQMLIPALFGHQAFSANFSYEPVEDRRPLQRLLQRHEWSDEISEAARTYGWTHFIVRKDYVHPTPVMLEQIFENDSYAVFRFPAGLQDGRR